jgi:hypothetical protein
MSSGDGTSGRTRLFLALLVAMRSLLPSVLFLWTLETMLKKKYSLDRRACLGQHIFALKLAFLNILSH